MTTQSSEAARRAEGRGLLTAAATRIAEQDAQAASVTAPGKAPTAKSPSSRLTTGPPASKRATPVVARPPAAQSTRSRAPGARDLAPTEAAQTAQAPAPPIAPIAPPAVGVPGVAPTWQAQAPVSPAPGFDDPAWSPPPPRPHSVATPDSKADAAFTLGIISIFLNVFYVPGILAIVWGGRERHENGKARTGFICGIIGTALSALWTLLIILAVVGTASAVNTAVDDLNSTVPAAETPAPIAAAPAVPAAPAPSASSTKAVYNVGDTAKTGDFAVTVYGFKNPQASANSFIQPDPGMHYVSVDVQLTNSDPKTQRAFSSLLGFHLVDAQNRQYDSDIFGAGLKPGAPDGMIAAGQSVRGLVVFEVPNGATGLKLRVQGNITAAGALFNLA